MKRKTTRAKIWDRFCKWTRVSRSKI